MYIQYQMKKKKRKTSASSAVVSRERLLEKMPELREIVRGSLVERYRRCGRPNCHCALKGDQGHGPAYYLMVTVAPGKTVQVYVPNEHKREVQRWIKSFRRAQEVLEEVSAINRRLLKEGCLFRRE